MSTLPFTPLTLNGVSQYSSDLQKVLNRAVQIASIPVQFLQNKDSDVLQRRTSLAGLESTVSGLASSLESLGKVAEAQAVTAASSDAAVVAVSNTGSSTPATYTINSVTSPATAANERSLSSYLDSASTPVSATGTMQLVVGAAAYTFTLDNNNLISLRDQINSLGAGVTASILTTSGGNYLTISANATGATTLQLVDDPVTLSNPAGANTPWITSVDQGTDAVFKLNGIDISQPSNVVNSVIPGVTFTIQSATSSPVTLSLSSNPSKLSAALQDFVTNYNQLRSALNQQEGPAAGMLSGDTSITQLEDVMRRLASYQTSTGSVTSLSDLGIEFDTAGNASFNQSTFAKLTPSQLADGFKFLGSATAGFGGFSAELKQLSDPLTGLIKTEQDGLDRTDKSIQAQITTLTDRITSMQTNLAARLQKADALLAQLQSQQQTISASLQALNLVLYGRNPNQTA